MWTLLTVAYKCTTRIHKWVSNNSLDPELPALLEMLKERRDRSYRSQLRRLKTTAMANIPQCVSASPCDSYLGP